MSYPDIRTMQKFRRTLGVSDFGITADKTFQPTTWNTVGTYTVPAQTYATFGQNDPVGGATAAGACCEVDLRTAADAQIAGKIRLDISNATETMTVTAVEESSARMGTSATDRQTAVLIPEFGTVAKEDSKLMIKIYLSGASAATMDYGATSEVISVPVTLWQ